MSHTTFRYEPFGHPATIADVKEMFNAILSEYPPTSRKGCVITAATHAIEVWANAKMFEELFKLIFVDQKLYPTTKPDSGVGVLPTLFIGAEKTQVRQIPLADERPYPFKFLLELGGMIVCKSTNKRDLLLELRQYMNNYPHFRMRVHAEEWPTGEILIVTTWFQVLERKEARQNVNVPN